ncbi:MAG: N-acetyltransferase family protein [Bryobacteraceae bacterium]
MTLEIRRAVVEDVEIVAAFNAAMARETEKLELKPEVLLAGVTAVLADETKGYYFVAEHDGRVIGQAMITFEWSDWRHANFWWLQSVYVHQEYRERGVFTSLYRHIFDESKAAGACGLRLYVEKENERARCAYERLGLRRAHYDLYEIDFVLGR